jgi:hypothetical protein
MHPAVYQRLVELGKAEAVLVADYFHAGFPEMIHFHLVKASMDADIHIDPVRFISSSIRRILCPNGDGEKTGVIFTHSGILPEGKKAGEKQTTGDQESFFQSWYSIFR